MVTMITDTELEASLKAARQATGADRYDEVWEGVTMMAPMPNDEHQQVVIRLASIFLEIIDRPGQGDVRAGVNVSDRQENWQANYRVPDVAVFLKGGRATNCDTFWLGGPDFAVEIVSPEDQTRRKVPFYAKVRVQELLVVDRDPWRLELYRPSKSLEPIARVGVGDDNELECQVIPFTFKLLPGKRRPQIEVVHNESGRRWEV